MEQLKIFLNKHQDWFGAIGWVFLLSLFTYTSLFCNLLKVTEPFEEAYRSSQSDVIALVVNIGLLCMLMVDYMGAGKAFTYRIVIGFMGAVVFPILIFSITVIQMGPEATNYVGWLRNPCILYFLHGIFLAILTWLKKETLVNEKSVCTVKKSF